MDSQNEGGSQTPGYEGSASKESSPSISSSQPAQSSSSHPENELKYEERLSGLLLTTTQEEYPVNVTQIICTVENPKQEEDAYGENFRLQKLVNGEWETVPFKKGGDSVKAIAWIAFPESQNKISYNIKYGFDLPLEPGEYRIIAGGNEYGTYMISMKSNTFEIK